MSPFHDGMNHWQRKWLSDQLHRNHPSPEPYTAATPPHPPVQVQRKDPDIFKVRRSKPSPADASAWLNRTIHRCNPELVKALLTRLSPNELNDSSRKSCTALEQLVRRRTGSSPPTDEQRIQCIEVLLDAGARWNAQPETMNTTRGGLLGNDNRYIVQVLRLLLFTPAACDMTAFLELCRSTALQDKIAAVDTPLLQDLQKLRESPPAPAEDGPSNDTRPKAPPHQPEAS